MGIVIIISVLMLQVSSGLTQVVGQEYILRASIIDESTQAPLPYATVYNQTRETGTASNADGFFELPQCQSGDTIVASYVGYSDRSIVLSSDLPTTLYLSPSPRSIGEVVITVKSDYLVKMVAKLRKNKKTPVQTAKTYFFLETEIEDQSVEIIEAHFNGQYADLGIEDLSLKKGRIGLKPLVDRYYLSTESARLFCMHRLFVRSDLFPKSPLSTKTKKLKSTYTFTLSSTYTDAGSTIYVIDFTPKRDQDRLFSGRLWIDRAANRLLKVNLSIEHASVHPFLVIGSNTIEAVSMEITKSYGASGSESYINAIDFNYEVTYRGV
jgi:hypothetical protein